MDSMDTETDGTPPTHQPARRFEELSESQCLDLLGRAVVGRIGFTAFSVASIRPVNYVLDGRSIVFRTASGAKFSPALRRAEVCFEVDYFDPVPGTGWSVIASGPTGVIHDPDRIARIDRALTSWMSGDLGNLVCIDIERISGRRITMDVGLGVNRGRTVPS